MTDVLRMPTCRETAPAAWPDQLTEASAARRFADEHADCLRYDHARNRWLVWRGHRWERDADGEVVRLVLAAARRWQHEALDISDTRRKAAVLDWAISFDRKMKVESLLGLARCLAPLADTGTAWDADDWLLGVPNGVLDLRTGTLRPGHPHDRITKQTAVPFDLDAPCPRFDAFMGEVFLDLAMQTYVWKALGYSLAGGMREQVFFLLHGRGSNGKSTLVDTVSYVLGDYAHPAPFSAFEILPGNGIPADVAALDGKRFVTASETNGRWLHAPRLKDITGGERMTVRHLYGHPFTFRPTCKVWLSVNELPRVADDSDGLWRRLKRVPFTERFEGAADDKHLKATLRGEAAGILAWMVRGGLAWQEDGLAAPPLVTAATDDFRRDADVLGRFLDEACDLDPTAEVSAADLHQHYLRWADRAGFGDRDRLGAIAFGRKMAERQRRVRTHSGPVYLGLRRRGV